MKVYANVDLTGRSDEDVEFVTLPHKGNRNVITLPIYAARTALQLKKLKIDAALIFNASSLEMIICQLLKWASPGTLIYYFDINLKKPNSFNSRLYAWIKKGLLRHCDTLLCVHKDTRDYQAYFGATKTYYIPFKANNFEVHDSIETSDDGYLLACGVSHRDYYTFFQAVEDLEIPVKVVLPNDANIKTHKAFLGDKPIPANVEVIRHDFDPKTWNNLLARASIVVIPITEDCIQPAGVSVYLEAMLLHKPVIISKCPSSNMLIDNGESLLVERANPQKLRETIIYLLNNREKRNHLAETGYQYAYALRGVDRLVSDLKGFLIKARNGQKPS